MFSVYDRVAQKLSPSSRRAWIEIPFRSQRAPSARVALLAEGVDRNAHKALEVLPDDTVALLAEGVDRNELAPPLAATDKASPSSRRAWIEIKSPVRSSNFASVALLAEGVDRNTVLYLLAWLRFRRPPRGGRG